MSATALYSLPTDRYVAFVDILGFRRVVERMFHGEPELYSTTLDCLKQLKVGEAFSEDGGSQLTAFSDSIVISVGPEEGLPVLTAHLMVLVGALLKQGVLCRGGVALGRTYHADGILVGEGLIRAYDLERIHAKFPRIILEHDLAEHLWLDLMPLPAWERDIDGYLYLNVLSHFTAASDRASLVSRIEAAAQAQLDEQIFERLREVLKRLLQSHKQANASPDILAKYEWAARDFNRVVRQFLAGRVDPIPIAEDASS